jgi:hypothetical protein
VFVVETIAHADTSFTGSRSTASVDARPARIAYRVLHVGFFLLPAIAGLDKFFDFLANWALYLAPIVPQVTHLQPHTFMMLVGVVEIAAALLVAFRPRVGAWVVALWLWGIIGNLVMLGGFYDVALRDFGLSLGAIALAQLSREFDV